MDVPVIETPRLRLRAMTVQDLPGYAALWADPRVAGQVGIPVRTRQESWQALLRIAGHWTLLGFGLWAVCRRSDGAFLGQVGFFHAMRGHGADFDPFPEAGWILGQDGQGQGFGPEAAEAAHAWFDVQRGGPTVAQIVPANARSQALAARLGYRPFAEAEPAGGGGGRVILYRRG